AGPLRELPERGARCDFRVVNVGAGGAGNGDTGFGEWPMRLFADQAQPMLGGRPRRLTSFSGQRVHAVAGIGDPERFFSMLRG
ncbi:tetraacyldisaccharide 4'-kinase, partial [Variovorax sp. 2RAF20]